jgi:polyferredoxin
MNSVSYSGWRWVTAWTQAIVIVGLPFVRVDNESVLRFDIPSLKLYFFGSVFWISEATFFLLVFLLLFTGVFLFTLLYTRIWCNWMCPRTVLSLFTHSLERATELFTDHRTLRPISTHAVLFLFSALVSVSLVWYFVSPYDMMTDILTMSLGPWTFWSWVFLSGLAYVNLSFARNRFCVSICPIARFRDAQPLIEGQKSGRPRVVSPSIAFAFIAALFAYQVFVRMPVDFWVMRDEAQVHHNVEIKGATLNAYVLVVENRSLQFESYRLSVSGIREAELVVPQNPLRLPPNSAARIKVYVYAKRKDLVDRVTPLRFTLESTSSREIRIVHEAPFIYPDRTDKGVEI